MLNHGLSFVCYMIIYFSHKKKTLRQYALCFKNLTSQLRVADWLVVWVDISLFPLIFWCYLHRLRTLKPSLVNTAEPLPNFSSYITLEPSQPVLFSIFLKIAGACFNLIGLIDHTVRSKLTTATYILVHVFESTCWQRLS